MNMRRFLQIASMWILTLTLTFIGSILYATHLNPSFFLFQTTPRLRIPQIYSIHDENQNGINDTQDLIDGARFEVKNQPVYASAYYQGGYPPDAEGVCSDVIWRAFKHAGYDLKKLIDLDIQKRTKSYTRVDGKPDPNIDFRRVPNLLAFFRANATILTNEIHSGNPENLSQWQGGDIVLFDAPHPHIGIVSDKRDIMASHSSSIIAAPPHAKKQRSSTGMSISPQ